MGRCGAEVISDVSDGMSTGDGVDQVYYTWRYRHGVDEKRRVQIPARWRSPRPDIKYSVILWPHGGMVEACLSVMPPEQWSALVRSLQGTKPGDPKAESLRRLIGGKSLVLELDKAGRIGLPEEMAEAAAIGDEALLIGMVEYFQIWNPKRYEAVRIQDEAVLSDAFKLI
jgi:MraZ protein